LQDTAQNSGKLNCMLAIYFPPQIAVFVSLELFQVAVM